MKVEPSGIVMIGECEVQLPHCTATSPAPVTAVFTPPNRRQVDVCRSCLQGMVRNGEWEIAGARLRYRIDIAGYDAQGSLQLVVEVRKSLPVTRAEKKAQAVRIHRNLLLHSAVPQSRFFLLAFFPQPFYLWVNDATSVPEAPPDYVFDAQNEVRQHLRQANAEADDEKSRSAAVETWLREAVRSGQSADEHSRTWLLKSGLYEALKGGRIVGPVEADLTPLRKSA